MAYVSGQSGNLGFGDLARGSIFVLRREKLAFALDSSPPPPPARYQWNTCSLAVDASDDAASLSVWRSRILSFCFSIVSACESIVSFHKVKAREGCKT